MNDLQKRTWAEIRLDNIRHNYRSIRAALPAGCRFLGVVKADVGIKDGKIAGIGKAGNPDIMPNVCPELITGAATDAISGEHLILTAGAIDGHVHVISPQQAEAALSNGITTLVGGGIGPSDGTNGTTITPGKWNIERILQSFEGVPINIGLLGKGNVLEILGESQLFQRRVAVLRHAGGDDGHAAVFCLALL